MRCCFILLALVYSFHPLCAEEIVLYSEISSNTYSEPTSIDSFQHDFNGNIEDGEFAYTTNRVEIGARYRYFSLALVSRYDYFVEFNNDLARAYHAATHDVLPTDGSEIDVYLKASHLRGYGLKYGVHWQPMEGVTLRASITGLSADQMVDGRAIGAVGYQGDDEYQGEIVFNLFSYRDLLLEMPVSSPKGRGHTIDLGIDWQISPKWHAVLDVEDGYSKIKWRDVLYSDLLATSATIHFDQAGRLHTSPAISGKQLIVDMNQRLPVKYRGLLQHDINDRHGLFVDAVHISSYLTMPSWGYSYRASAGHQLRWHWNSRSHALGMEYRSDRVKVNIATDSLNGRRAHNWELSLAFNMPVSW